MMGTSPRASLTLAGGSTKRFVFIDAMRGLAAVAVLFFHLYHGYEFELVAGPVSRLWESINLIGARGVQVFFVISGFVIAHSLRTTKVTLRQAAAFGVRRQIRLDPTYWAVLSVAVAVNLAAALAHGATTMAFGQGRAFVVNALYLPFMLHEAAILGVSWTLCLEIQFYVLFLTLLASGQRIDGGNHLGWTPLLIAITACWSVLLQWHAYAKRPYSMIDSPWCPYTWHMFALGALSYWVSRRRSPAWTFIIPAALTGLAGLWLPSGRMLVATTTASTFLLLGRRDLLERWSLGRPLQYLGAISYSLYLVHSDVALHVYRIGHHLTGTSWRSAVLWSVTAAAASVAVADLLFRAVEAPTRRLASGFKVARHATAGPAGPISQRPHS